MRRRLRLAVGRLVCAVLGHSAWVAGPRFPAARRDRRWLARDPELAAMWRATGGVMFDREQDRRCVRCGRRAA